MSGKIQITKDMMAAARDYIPLAEKEAWVAENAPKCFDKLVITADDEPMPPMYMVNTGLKSRYLMAAFAMLYFGEKSIGEDSDPMLMTVENYDAWAGSHVFNQLERWKRDEEMRFKAYDLIADYKDLEKRFSSQLSGLLNVQNDAVLRQSSYSAAQIKGLPALIEELKALEQKKEAADGRAASAV